MQVKFYICTQAEYDALQNKDFVFYYAVPNSISGQGLSEGGNLYIGENLVNTKIQVIDLTD